MIEQSWFEMHDIRRKKFNNAVWIPLRAMITSNKTGKFGYVGYHEEFFGIGSLAVPIGLKEQALQLGWSDIGISHHHRGYCEDQTYIISDEYQSYRGDFKGIHLVLEQLVNSQESKVWHLHQDFVVSLGLIREGDIWVAPDEGYIDVAKLIRDEDGNPNILEVRAEHLKDYLCARNMGLYTTAYYDRDAIVEEISFLTWENESNQEDIVSAHWEGRYMAIHEGGEPYGEKIAVFHCARTDIDPSDDIPDLSVPPNDENTISSSWEKEFEGRKLFRVMGELWKNEWIEPSKISPRVRRDELPATIFFIIDEQGTKESKETLEYAEKWLWFKPDVMMALSHRRGGNLGWYTQDTGSVRCSPDYSVHFGINKLGLINVYAEDIAKLPDWQQQIWAGYNIAPEGGVSEELLASQVQAQPARTKAPEAFLFEGIELLKEVAVSNLGIKLFREHEYISELTTKIHRFRAIDIAGLYALSKDLARITADSLDASAMQSIVPPPKGTTWGSLKSLENLLASKIERSYARQITAPLVGIYELRLADAHLPTATIDEAFDLLKVDRTKPLIFQAHHILYSCVTSIYTIVEILREWDDL